MSTGQGWGNIAGAKSLSRRGWAEARAQTEDLVSAVRQFHHGRGRKAEDAAQAREEVNW